MQILGLRNVWEHPETLKMKLKKFNEKLDKQKAKSIAIKFLDPYEVNCQRRAVTSIKMHF